MGKAFLHQKFKLYSNRIMDIITLQKKVIILLFCTLQVPVKVSVWAKILANELHVWLQLIITRTNWQVKN